MSGAPAHGPVVVGTNLTPLQTLLIAAWNADRTGKNPWFFNKSGVAALGSDNSRSKNLLTLMETFFEKKEPLPETLSAYLARHQKGWSKKRAATWIANLAQRGILFIVADGNTPDGFQMRPPEVPQHEPKWETLVATFKKFRCGTVAELKVLRLFGYTPSDQSRMNALMNRNRNRNPARRAAPARR